MWICRNCGEEGENNFEICWKCGAEREAEIASEKLENEETAREVAQPPETLSKGVRLLPALAVLLLIALVLAIVESQTQLLAQFLYYNVTAPMSR
jgi:uncharacterized membrane protein YvbJ